jgi:hypothetical protein
MEQWLHEHTLMLRLGTTVVLPQGNVIFLGICQLLGWRGKERKHFFLYK